MSTAAEKEEVVYVISLLLSITEEKHKKDLSKMSVDTLQKIYREYMANAQNTNHQADYLGAAQKEILDLKTQVASLKIANKALRSKGRKR